MAERSRCRCGVQFAAPYTQSGSSRTAKVPKVLTHEKVLKDCEAEFDEFIDRMNLLDEKLGPLSLQFPWFNKYEMQAGEFSRRLRFFLQRVKNLPTVRFAVEIRNKAWLDKRFTDLLREYNLALALTDQVRMLRPRGDE